MNDKGNMYAMAALKARRAEMAGEIKQLTDMLAYRKEQLGHLDATIKNFWTPISRSRQSRLAAPGK